MKVVPAKHGDEVVYVEMDDEDVDRLGSRKLSIGSHGYAQMWEPSLKRVLLVHRWVCGLTEKTGYAFLVDHEDRDVWNCQRSNLRPVSPSESNMNRRITTRDLPLGVYRTRTGRYHAQLKRFRKITHLGTYDTPEEAAVAVESAFDPLAA